MFGWLPIIGPIIDGIVSIFRNVTDLKKDRDAKDIEEIKARLEVIKEFKDDIGVRLCRDLIMFPVAVWCALGTWDTIIAFRFPEWRFIVEKFPPGPLEYLPLAVLGFLFGLNIRRLFK